MMNKRGQGLSTNAIILIILGIAVLVMLILGFTIGWSKLLPFISSENVATVANGCVSACSTKSIYGFCTQPRTLIDAEDNEFTDTCYNFATDEKYAKYGVAACPSVTSDCEALKAEEIPEAPEVAE